jgi:hypothetical protein
MSDISTVRTDLLSIVGNNRLPIETKRFIIESKLKAINTFIDLKPNKIHNKKKIKINKILSILPSIKYNVNLKKLLTQKLITELTNFESYPEINSEDKEEENLVLNQENIIEAFKNVNPKNILITEQDKSSETDDSEIESTESEKSNESLNSDSDTEEKSDVSDEDSYEDSDEESNEETDELENTVNNLMEDLPNKEKVKLIIKLTKYKLEHEYKMESENNRNIERMEELAIKKLKIKNKYKIKKLENRK